MTAIAAKPPRLSPTALNQWETCPRSWFYAYLCGLRAPPTTAMLLGTAVHAEVERWLTSAPAAESGAVVDRHGAAADGEPLGHPYAWGDGGSLVLDRSYRTVVGIARAGERYLAPLRARVAAGHAQVEVAATRPPGDVGPLAFSGRVDVVDAPHRLIVDHKTTAGLDLPWLASGVDASTGAVVQTSDGSPELARDTQMLLYAWAVLPPGAPVTVAHIRYRTRGDPLAQMVIAPGIPWDHVAEQHAAAVGVSTAMASLADHHAIDTAGEAAPAVAHAQVRLAAEVEWRPGGCRKYGGCPFRGRCPDSPDNRAARLAIPAYAVAAAPTSAPAVGAQPHPGVRMSSADVMSLFGVPSTPPPPSNGGGHAAASTAALPSAIASLLGAAPAAAERAAAGIANVVPPDARPDAEPALARAVAAVRALGGWPGVRVAHALAAQHGVSPEALTYAAAEAGMGPDPAATPTAVGGASVAAGAATPLPTAQDAAPGATANAAPTTAVAAAPGGPSKAQAERDAKATELVKAVVRLGGSPRMAVAVDSKALWASYATARGVASVRGTHRVEARQEATARGWLDAGGPADGLLLTESGVTAAAANAAPTPAPAPVAAPDAQTDGYLAGIAERSSAATGLAAGPAQDALRIAYIRAEQLRTALGASRTGFVALVRVQEICGSALADVVRLGTDAGWLRAAPDGSGVELSDAPAISAMRDAGAAELAASAARAAGNAPAAPVEPMPTGDAARVATARGLGLHFVCLVLVDCVPIGPVSPQALRDAPAIAGAVARVEAREGCSVDLIPYARGPAMVVAELRGFDLAEPGVWLADGRDPLAGALLGILHGAGAVVVRGVR